MTQKERAEIREAMRTYKAEGHTMSEVADRFGYNKSYVQRICKGIAPQQARPAEYRNQYTNGTFDREANIIKCITERAPNFEYVGEFTGVDGFVNLKCKVCGTVTRKSCVTVRHGHATCDECKRRERFNKQIEQERERNERERTRWLSKTWVQKIMAVCPCCGDMFIPSYGRKYCSDKCSKRVQYATAKDKRIQKIKHAVVDKGITLQRLYERDNGKCYLCGQICDWSDCERRDGAFIAYDNYPSIDHVIPLSKGGLHAWDNVRLACRGCNTMKRDTISPPCRVTA